MFSHGIWFMSFLVNGLLIQALKGQEDAEYSTYSWNQNQHRYRPTNEPRLGAFDRVNTRDDSEELEPVTNPRDVVINKAVPGQEMHRDVLNSGYVVSDGRSVSRKHMPVKQTHKRTTIEPRQRVFDRIHTTDVYEEFEPVTNNQPQNPTTIDPREEGFDRTITTDGFEEFEQATNNQPQNMKTIEPQQEVFDRTITTDGSEEFEPVTMNQRQNPTTIEPRQEGFDRTITTDGFEEFEQVTNNQPQNPTTIEPQQEVFDRTITTHGSEEFEPVTKNRPQNPATIEPQQGVFDRISTTVNSEEFEPVTNNEPQRRTTTKPRLGVFDRMNTTDNSEEFEPVTQNQPQTQTTTTAPLGVLDRIYPTVDSVTSYKSMAMRNGNIRLIHDGVKNGQAAESRAKLENTVNTLVKRENASKGQVRSLYSVINRSKETSLQRKQTAENEVNIRNR